MRKFLLFLALFVSLFAHASCPTGYSLSPDTGGCVPDFIGSTSSNSSSSSSVIIQNTSTTLQTGWNLISVPMQTETEFNLNLLLNEKATIAYKFNTDSYTWDKWLPGTATMTMKNGEGVFVGVPTSNGSPSLSFSGLTSNGAVRFEDTNYEINKWYLLGFGYDMTVENIKAKYPNSVIFTMENGAYIIQDNNSTTILKGQGFWFKTKTAKMESSSSSSSSSSSILSSSNVSSSSSTATMSSSSSSQNSTTIRTINDIVGRYTLESVYSKVSQVTLELNANDLAGSYMNIQSNGSFTMHLEIDEYGQSETTTATISSMTDKTITAASNADDEGTIEYTFDGTLLTFIFKDYSAYVEYRWRLQ